MASPFRVSDWNRMEHAPVDGRWIELIFKEHGQYFGDVELYRWNDGWVSQSGKRVRDPIKPVGWKYPKG